MLPDIIPYPNPVAYTCEALFNGDDRFFEVYIFVLFLDLAICKFYHVNTLLSFPIINKKVKKLVLLLYCKNKKKKPLNNSWISTE